MENEGQAGKAEAVERVRQISDGDSVAVQRQATAPDETSRIDMAGDHRGDDVGNGSDAAKKEGLTWSPSAGANQADLEPGFAHIDGDIEGTGYNETKVDVITVPCPGADPVQTWASDPLPDDYFGSPSYSDLRRLPTVARLAADAILSPAIDRPLPKAGHMWVRQGIRRSANTARVLLYRHRALVDGINLEILARDLLDQVQKQRQGTRPSRPIFFIAHSIGGLVVKLALLLASKLPEYREIKYNCHGVAFFATPHRGSSYMSMKNLKESIRQLLRLQRSLPKSLSDEIRVGHPSLFRMQDEFVELASELRIWSLYETIDSELSGLGNSRSVEVQFGAPLVSIKSALLELRHEDVFAVESDHAHLASFGLNNTKTMATFLEDFTGAILKAKKLSAYIHTPLRLKDHVKVEVIGFYEDPDAEMESTIRLYATKYHLGEFLVKGPEKCLAERLNRVVVKRRTTSLVGSRTSGEASSGLNVFDNAQKAWQANPIETLDSQLSVDPDSPDSPNIIVTSASTRPSISLQGHPFPIAARGGQAHSESAPALPTLYNRPSSSHSIVSTASTASTASEPAIGLSNIDVAAFPRPDFRESDLTAKQREEMLKARFVIRDPTAGFSRPDPKLRKFMWIHTPFTNPSWVRNIFDKLSETQNHNFSRLFNYDNWESKHIHSSHSQAQPSYAKPSCSWITSDTPASPWVPSSFGGRVSPGVTPNCLYVYFPYLHFDTYQSIVRRRNLIKRRLHHGRATPVPQDIAELESLESRVLWEYLGYDPPINCRRTLDQFGYPSLQDTHARDDDQMLYKLTKAPPLPPHFRLTERESGAARTAPSSLRSMHAKDSEADDEDGCGTSDDETEYEEETDLRDGNLLMVDQLWLWAIDTTTLATFFPKRESDPREGTLFQQADLRNSVYNELNGDLTGRTENALELAAFIVFHAVTVFLDRSSHPDLEVFRIFEEAIGLLAERMTLNMKHFRLQAFKAAGSDSEEEEEEEEEENSPAAIKRRHKRELEKAERENRENTSALLQLMDLDDELNQLSKLFETQESVIKTMKTIYTSKELRDITGNGQYYLEEALEYLDEYKQQAKDMLKRVDTVRKDYEKMLEMAQRQAQVDEVRWSRVQTELASSQNLSVMIFTTFTVIFLPLSFFTGLFGMNTSDWPEDNLPTLREIGQISLPTSIGLIILALIAAYNWRAQALVKSIFVNAKRGLYKGIAMLGRLEPKSVRNKKKRRKAEEKRRRKAEMARKEKDMSYDFWATVKQGRTTAYEIPHLNRHGA